ncbi:hypothetical protein HanIR_Chr04g0163181 [Helianthus annuus]|nr:hypothetical protein HanIR_Chr04g0163181 [Helianthus annuus]
MQEEFEAKVEIFRPSAWLWDLIFQRCGFQSSGCDAMITWSSGLSSRYLRSSVIC